MWHKVLKMIKSNKLLLSSAAAGAIGRKIKIKVFGSSQASPATFLSILSPQVTLQKKNTFSSASELNFESDLSKVPPY